MKYLENVTKTCPVCGKDHNYQKLGENNSFGLRDLDTRPPGMMRSMLHLMVEKCPNCGYVSYDMNKPLKNFDINELNSERYQTILQDENLNFAIKKFMLVALLYETRDAKTAGLSYLRTAWLADDAKNATLALKMRSKAIKYLELSLKEVDDENIKLIIVDLYRRLGMFLEASDYANFLLNNYGFPKYKQNILRYQIELCQNEDMLDHTIPGRYDFTTKKN